MSFKGLNGAVMVELSEIFPYFNAVSNHFLFVLISLLKLKIRIFYIRTLFHVFYYVQELGQKFDLSTQTLLLRYSMSDGKIEPPRYVFFC